MSILRFPVLLSSDSTLKDWSIKLSRLSLWVRDLIRSFEVKSLDPTISASGSMTVSAKSRSSFQYIRILSLVLFTSKGEFTLGGTASNTILIASPIGIPGPYSQCFSAFVDDGGTVAGFGYATPESIAVRRYDNANFSLGTARAYRVSGFFFVESE